MKETYTISELADYFNISTQTLRYYDRIGLLKPERISESSGYRLYTMRQFNMLYMIRELKVLGLSLNQIRDFCSTRDIRELRVCLEETLEDLTRQIETMKQVQHRTQEYLRRIRLQENVKNSESMEICQFGERFAYILNINFTIDRLRDYIPMMQSSFSYSPLRNLEPGRVVLGIRQDALEKKSVNVYHQIGHMLHEATDQSGAHCYPKGLYAVGCHLGSYSTIGTTYQKLFSYIEKEGYQVAGDSLEISVVDIAFSENPEDFVTEIQIPVRPI